jgi:hypothetical protein
MRKLQLFLAAGFASGLTALGVVVAITDAQPAAPPNNTEAPPVVGTVERASDPTAAGSTTSPATST